MFNQHLIERDWEPIGVEKYDSLVPERLIALDHYKKQRLINALVSSYSFVLPFLTKPSKVLDACCGSGFGSQLMAESGHDILGVDHDGRAIAFAMQRSIGTFKQDNIVSTKRTGTLPTYGEFDAITLVEAIEHFYQKDQRGVIETLYRQLKPGGFLFLTTPLHEVSKRESKAHPWVLSWEDLYDLVCSDLDWQRVRQFHVEPFYEGSFIIPTELRTEFPKHRPIGPHACQYLVAEKRCTI
jgi:2-polyprenyl-3-methyl-5-hydroxy-6-metoxy-1,4-benzoquinol methylase